MLPLVLESILQCVSCRWAVRIHLDEATDETEYAAKMTCTVRRAILGELIAGGFGLRLRPFRKESFTVAYLESASMTGTDVISILQTSREMRRLALYGLQMPLPFAWCPSDGHMLTGGYSFHIRSAAIKQWTSPENWKPLTRTATEPPFLPEESDLKLIWECNASDSSSSSA